MLKRICVFGDSIAHGSWDPEGGGWVERLRKYIHVNGLDFAIYNLSVSGDNTNNLLKRLENECGARQPEIIIFSIGINDAQFLKNKGKMRVLLSDFKKNVLEIADIGRKFSKKIAFVGMTKVDESITTPIPWATDKHYLNKNISEYDQAIADFCDDEDLPFFSLCELLKEDDLADGLHPNATGHEKIFQRVKEVLIKEKVI